MNEQVHFITFVDPVISLWYDYQQNEHPSFKRIVEGDDYEQSCVPGQLCLNSYSV